MIKLQFLEIQEKLNNSNIFLIGHGALGCEYLKTFSLMGITIKIM